MENLLPTFWTEALSRIFGDIPAGQGDAAPNNIREPRKASPRKGKRTSVDARRETAKKMQCIDGIPFGKRIRHVLRGLL